MHIGQGTVVIANGNNVYHTQILAEVFAKRKVKQAHYKIKSIGDLVKLQSGLFMLEPEVSWLDLDEDLTDFSLGIRGIDMRGRTLIVLWHKYPQFRELKKVEPKQELSKSELVKLRHLSKRYVGRLAKGSLIKRVEVVPKLTDYQDRYDVLYRLISHHYLGNSNKREDRKYLGLIARNMMRDTTSWASILSMFDLGQVQDVRGLQDVIDTFFVDTSVYKLEIVLLNILFGVHPQVSAKGLYYFLHIKGYSANWLIKRLVSTAVELDAVYTLYYAGVLDHPVQPEYLDERLQYLHVEGDYTWLKYQLQRFYLDRVSEFSYANFSARRDWLLGYLSKVSSRSEEVIYSILEKLKEGNELVEQG